MGGQVDWDEFRESLVRAEEQLGFSGIVRVSRGSEVLLESCHGLADRAAGVPVTSGTRFATASLSKMFTAVAVLDAAQRGEVRLDAAVVDVLPPDRRPTTLRRDVTVHHLLTHTSGIADYYEEDEDLPGYTGEDYSLLWADRPCYSVRGDRDLLPLFADLPPIGKPGEACHYSNAGYVLLGLLVEEVTGGRFQDVVVERVFEPAGMTSSGYPAMDEVSPGVAVGYLPRKSDHAPWRSNIFSTPAVGGGDGGAVVTAGDVDRFLRAAASGTVWGREVREQMLTPHATIWQEWQQGYGVEITPTGAWGKDGGDPGVETMSQYHPRSDIAFVYLANVEDLFQEVGKPILDAADDFGGDRRSTPA